MSTIIISGIVIIGLIISVILLLKPYLQQQNSIYKTKPHPVTFVEQNEYVKNEYAQNKPVRDPIIVYDESKIYDPLSPPTRRIPRQDMYPPQIFNIPTQGYPDNYTQIGILTNKCTSKCDDKILRLFGRQEYPRSNKYEYYTMIPSGNDQIKIPIKVKQNELYDDDEIYIKELGKHYKVQMHEYDRYKYYPDVYVA